MAVLKGIEERFYQIPDEELAKYLIPADQVGEVLRKAGVCSAPPAQQQQPMAAPQGQPMPQGQVQAYGRDHDDRHHGHGGPGIYFNYQNYSNYSNYANWGW
jgi:hypothetical protein